MKGSFTMNPTTCKNLAAIGNVTIAHAITLGHHVLDVDVRSNGETVTVKALRDRKVVKALTLAVRPRRGVSDEDLSAIARGMVTTLEGYDRDTADTFGPLGGWAYDYSDCVGAALSRIAANKKLLKKCVAAKKQKVA